MTMLSRVLGLVRDMVIARYFGAGAGADAFFVAFKIPNFLRRLFAEGGFSQAFVPVLADYKEAGCVAAVQGLINRVAGVLGGTLLALTVFTMLAAPLVTALFAPGLLPAGSRVVYFEAAAVIVPLVFQLMTWSAKNGFGLLHLFNLWTPLEAIMGFLLMDLSFYYWHRVNHAFPFFWRFHNVHHVDPDLFDVFLREKVYLEYAARFLPAEQIDDVDWTRIPGVSPEL